ncbi:translation initiation factor IF-2 [Striga asiatica]|uniref:Translation initiation factor IF-2 n=1 Tax=Striga asiatica TaxID=4170 RepID=A0A5A7PPN9_STRAF|nr:translation initiation factor IF-2 [Striga asiatica]
MAFDGNRGRKPLLYADLFKRRPAEKEAESGAISNPEVPSSISSLSSQLSSPRDSSSSGFSTPLYSDFESEDDDFIAELTREMAERMLEDDDDGEEEVEEEKEEKIVKSASGYTKKNELICMGNSSEIDGREYGVGSGRAGIGDPINPIQVLELKKQPKEEQFVGGKLVKGTETAQPKARRHQHRHAQNRWENRSRMQAVFLGGSGSGKGPSGTGFFLPQLSADPAQQKKKAGCSIVLMPTRVLQMLELHSKQRHQPTLPGGGPQAHAWPKLGESNTSKGLSQPEKGPSNGDEIQLPQEWTY